eukprot:NODE_1225_length_577_cov_446.782197_g1151_i0.p1 GENE.NODE_1225_length_577_cov_446.782197_g1151_i0~~NODE_1225_length_577_cov_446.782197_g1151_i0.p1  ORF type:complete len:112 (+),score=29.89 NODE_1225_length_577_cov_446.782197_g1151_i0:27-338(+)
MGPEVDTELNDRSCTDFYNYFLLDRGLQDVVRKDNPEVDTFGYCSRAWIFALLLFMGILMIFALIAFVLLVVGLIIRFREDRGYDPIELEVRAQGSRFGDYDY